MGCDIHTAVERQVSGTWRPMPELAPFDWQSYGMFGFLAGVRNYSAVPPLSEPRGLPDDVSPAVREAADDSDWHSHSWLSVAELAAFNYDQPLEDRRVMRNGNGGCTCDPGEGEMTTYREFLGSGFFDDLEKLKTAGAERVVFWFDS